MQHRETRGGQNVSSEIIITLRPFHPMTYPVYSVSLHSNISSSYNAYFLKCCKGVTYIGKSISFKTSVAITEVIHLELSCESQGITWFISGAKTAQWLDWRYRFMCRIQKWLVLWNTSGEIPVRVPRGTNLARNQSILRHNAKTVFIVLKCKIIGYASIALLFSWTLIEFKISLRTQIYHCDFSTVRCWSTTCLFRHVEKPEHVVLLFTLHLKCCHLSTLPPPATSRSRSCQGQQQSTWPVIKYSKRKVKCTAQERHKDFHFLSSSVSVN